MKYISQMLHLSYRRYTPVQGLQLNPVEYLGFTNCYGKANKETHALTQRHMIGHRLFDCEPIRNVFYLHEVISEIPR